MRPATSYEAIFHQFVKRDRDCYGGYVVIFLNRFILYNVHLIINPDPVTETTTKVGQHSVTI